MENLNKVRVNVKVTSMDEAIQFYVHKLGLELRNRYGDHYAEIDANGLIIGLHPGGASSRQENNVSIGFGVSRFDQTVARLGSRGIEFSVQKDGPIQLAHFSDPDGNPLFLAEN